MEIDQVIREIPGVKVSQTVGVRDALLGELVVSCIVPHGGVALNEDIVRSEAKKKLASFKVPRRVLFLEEAYIAVTGSAKIRTSELRKLAQARLAAADQRALGDSLPS